MKTLMKLSLAFIFALSVGSCKDKNADGDINANDTITVMPDGETMAADTVQVDSTDDEAAGVTPGEMEHTP